MVTTQADLDDLPNPLWVLQGGTGTPLLGTVARVPSGVWLVTITFGHETVLRESYPDRADAVERAATLKEGLVAKGWTHVAVRPL